MSAVLPEMYSISPQALTMDLFTFGLFSYARREQVVWKMRRVDALKGNFQSMVDRSW